MRVEALWHSKQRDEGWPIQRVSDSNQAHTEELIGQDGAGNSDYVFIGLKIASEAMLSN